MSPLTEPTRLVLKKDSVAATDTNIREVSLLLHGNGTNGSTTITDSSLTPKMVAAVGNAQISTAQSKFGGASIAFDGTGDYLTLGGQSDFAFGTGNFTVEFFLRLASFTAAAGSPILFDFRPASTAGDYPMLYVFSGNNSLRYFVNAADRITVDNALSIDTWQHIALTRQRSETKIFVNGVQGGSTYTDTNNYLVGSGRPWIGANGSVANGGGSMNGYIDELRITKDVARYTSNFTPPTAPFPDF